MTDSTMKMTLSQVAANKIDKPPNRRELGNIPQGNIYGLDWLPALRNISRLESYFASSVHL